MRKLLLAMVMMLWSGSVWANSWPSYTYTLANGTTADASQVMGNFNTIMNCASFFIGTTSTGSATAQVLATVTPGPGVFALTSGNRVTFIAGYTTTGATTLNIAGSGATTVYKKTASGLLPLGANDMIAGQVYTVQYDGTQYELLDPVGASVSSGTAGQIANYATTGTVVSGASLTSLLDSNFGSTQGDVLYRGASAWSALNPLPGTLTAGTVNTLNPASLGTVHTQAHGLGASPTLVIVYLQCLTADQGYSVGERIQLATNNSVVTSGTSTSSGITVSYDETNTYIITDTSYLLRIEGKSTKTAAVLTTADWEIIATPYLLN